MIVVGPGHRYRFDTHSDVACRLAEIVGHVVGRCHDLPGFFGPLISGE